MRDGVPRIHIIILWDPPENDMNPPNSLIAKNLTSESF
jgi:hypothetical protein